MLRLAAGVLRTGEVVYPRRRVGVVHDRRRFPARFPAAPSVDFWACDAAALPFADGTFALATALNVVDCAAAPAAVLASVACALAPGGKLVVSTPYDWSTAATPIEGWLGGHSQRGPDAGASEPLLRALLDGRHPGTVAGLRALGEAEIPWRVRLHDRSVVIYRVHVLAAERRSTTPSASG
jgi:SAM-dependent methyltransferase